jgi:hypothetical protein
MTSGWRRRRGGEGLEMRSGEESKLEGKVDKGGQAVGRDES